MIGTGSTALAFFLSGTVAKIFVGYDAELFQSICVLVLPIVFGINGIWWAMTVAEIFALIVSVGFIIGKRKKNHYM